MRQTENRRSTIVVVATCLILICVCSYIMHLIIENKRQLRVGFIYQGDAVTPYTRNFMYSQEVIEKNLGNRIKTISFYNVYEESLGTLYDKVMEANCDIIFANSFGYQDTIKEWAKKHPEIQFCQATNFQDGEPLPNLHNYMGAIHRARYTAGVVAGRKLESLIAAGHLTREQAVVGYVAALPVPEVISGYTAFLLGVRSQVPEATMKVIYVDSWSDFTKEKETTRRLLDRGCRIISQHSDTIGPAMVCEEYSARTGKDIIHVGYNGSMVAVAPNTSLVSCRIDWTPYEQAAIEAVLDGKRIEDVVTGETRGNDAWGGYKEGWIKVIGLNEYTAPSESQQLIESTMEELESRKKFVFSGPYTGVNVYDPSDRIDLSKGPFVETKDRSAPRFCYILDDIVEIVK